MKVAFAEMDNSYTGETGITTVTVPTIPVTENSNHDINNAFVITTRQLGEARGSVILKVLDNRGSLGAPWGGTYAAPTQPCHSPCPPRARADAELRERAQGARGRWRRCAGAFRLIKKQNKKKHET